MPTTWTPAPLSRRRRHFYGTDGQAQARQLRLGRRLRPRVRRAALHLQRARLLRALRAGRDEARLRRPAPRRDRARGPRQPRGQRRDPGALLAARRARQRLLARARRAGRPLARALAAPPGLPLRVAGPARHRGRARAHLRRPRPDLQLRPARSRRRADRARARALVGPGGLLAPLETRPAHVPACRMHARVLIALAAALALPAPAQASVTFLQAQPGKLPALRAALVRTSATGVTFPPLGMVAVSGRVPSGLPGVRYAHPDQRIALEDHQGTPLVYGGA